MNVDMFFQVYQQSKPKQPKETNVKRSYRTIDSSAQPVYSYSVVDTPRPKEELTSDYCCFEHEVGEE